jgi:hypothetical protein
MSSPVHTNATITVSSPPVAPRVELPARRGQAVVDAGWWPRSWDPLAELPGLAMALSDRYGPIRQMMLSSGTWKGNFRRFVIGTLVVRVGWFASLDPAVLIATTGTGEQFDVLVVPPETSDDAAHRALSAATDPTDNRRASDRLAAATAPSPEPTGPDENAVWDNEGGSASPIHSQRPQGRVSTVAG